MQSLPSEFKHATLVQYVQGLLTAIRSVRQVNTISAHAFKGLFSIDNVNNSRHFFLDKVTYPELQFFIDTDPKIDRRVMYLGNLSVVVDKRWTSGTDIVSVSEVTVSDFDSAGGIGIIKDEATIWQSDPVASRIQSAIIPVRQDAFFSHLHLQGDITGVYTLDVSVSFVGFRVTLN